MPNKPGNDDRNTATGAGADVGSSQQAQSGSNPPRTRSNRGFASMDREKQEEIASKGGKAAHAKGTAHEFDSGEAREAGRKGGVAVSRNREHMAAIGRRGGEARGANRAARMQQDNSGLTASAAGSQGSQSSSAQGANNGARFQGDREVGLRSNAGLANGNGATANRSSGNSLGGERSTGANTERNVERP